ncbi:carboxypeptidase regulatory-like domain-containing protein [Telmatobacter sp. DSM 110680]|uniref:Carboxypeptidase regulatory-like domain-containing protein n=1 Tax=Telmatobacter sp. DSM 110680 TaxID=3036704 RepID=A0AAU7DI04_9BACT
MKQWRWYSKLVIAALVCLCSSQFVRASEYFGKVTYGGLPVPGATVTAAQGTTTISITSDEGGVFRFDDLPDGQWKIQIRMFCFESLEADVTIAPKMPAAKFELKLLPADQLKALATAPPPQPAAPKPALQVAEKKPENGAGQAPQEMPKPPEDANQQSSDGFLVNGSVNNAATSQFSLNQAFGNRRFNTKSLYNGGFGLILDNSALDARQYSLSGFSTPKPVYDRITAGFTIGGPLKIAHLLPRGPNFFVGYQWTRNHTAQTDSALVPTLDERAGIINGTTFPVSPQADALLQLYPLPNITGNPSYNFQIPVLNSSHQDSLQSRLDKTIGRRDQLYGNFNFQSTRADGVNLFRFVDTTDILGFNTNVNWSHRLNQHLFLYAGYHFSRLRTLVRPEFANKQNISGAAGIGGNDQTPANWGPPALSFSSGIAALSDGQSTFNRNRTDGYSASIGMYRGHHNITIGGDFRKQQYNDYFQQDPRGSFTFTGAATGSDFADFITGVPDASSIAFGNADKYFREPVYDAYATDDWRVLPILTINAGMRWEYGAPITELKDRLVNLDVSSGFAQAAPVLASNPVGSVTGQTYPSSLVRPDRLGIEPRIGLSWRPIPASTIVIRAGYGVYDDTSVYLSPMLQLAQQAPLSKSVKEQNTPACPLTLANGFTQCGTTTADNFAIDPNFRVGYAQTWQVSIQRDLPSALQMTATYLGVKGTHGVQQFLPNSYPLGAANPCPGCPAGFVYETSGGNSTRQSGQLQLRRRLRAGFAASLLYTYSKSIDDDATLGGQGHQSTASQTDFSAGSSAITSSNAQIAQDWLDLKAERSLSSFDQRHLLNLQAQYTTGQGLEGGTLLGGWRGKLLKEWTILAQLNVGTGLPETPVIPVAVPGTGWIGSLRPSLSGAPIYSGQNGAHINPAAYTIPVPGAWGTAGRNSITGPSQFSLDSGMQRTFRPSKHFFLDARIDATNLLNHAVFSSWVTTLESAQFGLPQSAEPMRSLQATMRVRF